MTDIEYYTERARAERELSERATDPLIAAIHAELANRYEKMARAPKRPILHISSGLGWAG